MLDFWQLVLRRGMLPGRLAAVGPAEETRDRQCACCEPRTRCGKHSKWVQVAALFILAAALAGLTPTAAAIPAFARRTGLRCSACHESWPKLNNFGQAFRDNGYQIGNERDAPVYQSPLYWAMSLRMTPQWHRELNSAEATDQAAHGTQPVTTQGFDLAGLDIWAAGLLHKNISFVVLPSSDEFSNFHFESSWVRFDNLLKTPWLNVKAGKYELDTLISDKRILTLSQVGAAYNIYHYLPPIDPAAFALTTLEPGETGVSATGFGLGDNQLGAEVMGHAKNDYTRYTASVLTSSDGDVNLPTSKAYDAFFTGSSGFNIVSLGLERVGVFSYVGQAPTRYLTQTPAGGTTSMIAGSGYGNKGFTRTGAYGLLGVKKFILMPMYTHATESAYVALGIPSNDALPAGVQNPVWNGRMFEVDYNPTLQLMFVGRYEDIRNSTQTFARSVANFGDQDAETVAVRWNPFMTSRDGAAFQLEYAKQHSIGISPVGGNQTLSSAFLGIDFAF